MEEMDFPAPIRKAMLDWSLLSREFDMVYIDFLILLYTQELIICKRRSYAYCISSLSDECDALPRLLDEFIAKYGKGFQVRVCLWQTM